MDKNHAVDSSSNSSEDGTSSDGSDTEKDKTVSYLVCNINIGYV